MAIEEKQRALEFTFKPDNLEGDLKYDIVYDDRNSIFPLRISSGGNAIDYPIGLLVEIVDFLTGKGILEPKVLSRTAPTASIDPGTFSASLSPPTIEKKGGHGPQIEKKGGPHSSVHLTSNVDPLASFDITNDIPVKTHAGVTIPSITSTSKVPPIPKIIKAGSGIVIDNTTFAPSKEMVNRPVIRSRISNGDPLSAEREAAQLRNTKIGKGAKRVKRASGGE